MQLISAGIIIKNNKVLICQRKKNSYYGLKWEFPGGKVEANENLEESLIRELKEELDIEASIDHKFYTKRHQNYDGLKFEIHFYIILKYKKKEKNILFENIKWVTFSELNKYDFLEADREVILLLVKKYIGQETIYNNKEIEHILIEYKKKKKEIKNKLKEFSNVPTDEYFYELVYCLFTPQSSAENCFKAVSKIRDKKYLQKSFPLKNILHNKDGTYIRFHNNKEKYVQSAKRKYDVIIDKLSMFKNPFELREWLVKNIKGLSYKESTHFLRNIGKNGNLAILDRHVLKNLLCIGAINEIPKTLSKKKYLEIENKFQIFADYIKININELDLIFWSFGTGIILK
jgi:N-glycosylase/DNA lyase